MNRDFDCIVAVGCSFVAGANILDENGKFAGNKYTFPKLLGDHYGVPHYNLGEPGSGNQRIMYTLYEWLKNNPNKKPAVFIGLSGISRITFRPADMQYTNSYAEGLKDLHIFDYVISKDEEKYIPMIAKRFAGEDIDVSEFQSWVYFYTRYMFDLDFEQKKLNKEVEFLAGYLENKNLPYVIFNSVEDNLFSETKDEINYYSFNIDPNIEFHYQRADMGVLGEVVEDCWSYFLRGEFVKQHGRIDGPEFRSNRPPHGKFLCGGHPSPYANRMLADDLIRIIDTL